MKKLWLFLPVWLCCLQSTGVVTTYSLTEAVQKKLVVLTISGREADTANHSYLSSHYGPCMALQIYNTTNNSLYLKLDYGYTLAPDDSTLQTMIVTQTLSATVPAKQKKSYSVYAMCTEAHDASPAASQAYVLRNRATGNLLSLTALLNSKKYQSDAAQNAVWCLTNDYELSSIYSDDTAMMYTLRRFVARAKGLPAQKIYTAEPGEVGEPERNFTTRTTYSGSFSYSFSGTSNVLIGLFDEKDQLKKTYVNNETQKSGQYTYSYQISSDEMDGKKHYLRLFRDGRLQEEISIIP